MSHTKQVGNATVILFPEEQVFRIEGRWPVDRLSELTAFVAPKELEPFDIPNDSWFTDGESMYFKETEFKVSCFDPDGTPLMSVQRSTVKGVFTDLGKNPVKAWAAYTTGRTMNHFRFYDLPALTWFSVPHFDCKFLKTGGSDVHASRFDATGKWLDDVQIAEARLVRVLGSNPKDVWAKG